MQEYDEAVLQCFLKNQLQLFDEEVASTPEEAEGFLEDCMAVVVASAQRSTINTCSSAECALPSR